MTRFPRLFRASGVFAPLVGALVFKTSGGFEQSSQWVRFPYTPGCLSASDLRRITFTSPGQRLKTGSVTLAAEGHLARHRLRWRRDPARSMHLEAKAEN